MEKVWSIFSGATLRNQGGNIGIDKIDVIYDNLYLVHFHLLLLVIREFLLQFKKDW